MSSRPTRADTTPPAAPVMTPGLVRVFAFCCGVIVANIYYAQPIVELIAPALGLSVGAASLIVSLTQIGYATGLFLLVPLGDILENRRLILAMVVLTTVALTAAATAQQAPVFLAASLLIGLSSACVQMLVPLAASLAPAERRGRVVGNVMSGLVLGILLSRPIASLVADHLGWRSVFGGAALLMVVVAGVVAWAVPRHAPVGGLRYAQLLRSLVAVFRASPVLRQRSFYQACMFAAFSLFWTAVPIELARHHGLTQTQIALFALVGAAGVVSGPLGGRLADAGHTRLATRLALAVGALAWLPGLLDARSSVLALGVTAFVLDFCVQINMVLGQRTIYALAPESRGRVTALYMTSLFVGGAIGSAIASGLYAGGGWHRVALVGAAFPLVAATVAIVFRRARHG